MPVILKKMAPEKPKISPNTFKPPEKLEKPEDRARKEIYGKKNIWISLSILALFIFTVCVYIIKSFSYLSITSFCYIKIDNDIIRGNQKSIISSIKLLKREDKTAHKTLCKYIDTISENFCYNCDPRGEEECKYEPHQGCYIKGSKTIYLKPSKNNSEESVRNRAALLKKFADASETFWIGQ